MAAQSTRGRLRLAATTLALVASSVLAVVGVSGTASGAEPTSSTPDAHNVMYKLSGNAHLAGLNADATINGSANVTYYNATKLLDADLALGPTSVDFVLLGLIPAHATMTFRPVRSAHGAFTDDGLTLTSDMYVRYPSVSAFGFMPLAGGADCATSAPATVTWTATSDDAVSTTSLSGTFGLPSLNARCGLVGSLFSVAQAWPGNTVTATLTPSS